MGLAAVVVEEHARAAVHLADDDPLGAVDDEGAVVRHQGHVAHVDVLLLDVADRARAGVLVDVPDDQAQGHLQRRGVGHAALLALLDVVLGLLELVAHELQLGALREVHDREDRTEDFLQADAHPIGRRHVHLQEVIVGLLLHLDQIRHLGHFGDPAECPADTLASGKRSRHFLSSMLSPPAPGGEETSSNAGATTTAAGMREPSQSLTAGSLGGLCPSPRAKQNRPVTARGLRAPSGPSS